MSIFDLDDREVWRDRAPDGWATIDLLLYRLMVAAAPCTSTILVRCSGRHCRGCPVNTSSPHGPPSRECPACGTKIMDANETASTYPYNPHMCSCGRVLITCEVGVMGIADVVDIQENEDSI